MSVPLLVVPFRLAVPLSVTWSTMHYNLKRRTGVQVHVQVLLVLKKAEICGRQAAFCHRGLMAHASRVIQHIRDSTRLWVRMYVLLLVHSTIVRSLATNGSRLFHRQDPKRL